MVQVLVSLARKILVTNEIVNQPLNGFGIVKKDICHLLVVYPRFSDKRDKILFFTFKQEKSFPNFGNFTSVGEIHIRVPIRNHSWAKLESPISES